jgi:hypothetical protein
VEIYHRRFVEDQMVDGPNISYQPAVAYQGGQANTAQQEPKSGQTQPIQAPAADTQRGDQRSLQSDDSQSRGQRVDVSV